MGWLSKFLPRHGQTQLEGHIEARCGGPFHTQLNTREIVEGVSAIADQGKDSIESALAARNFERGSRQ
jgi:hypothetical protein